MPDRQRRRLFVWALLALSAALFAVGRLVPAFHTFNWFQPEDIRRGSGEALSIRQMIASVSAAWRIDPGRVFITGLSAGGAMASVMLATYPEVFAGGAIIAGLPYGSASTIPEAFDRMRGHGLPSERELQPNEVVVRTDQPLPAALEHLERTMIQHALAACHGRLEQAARTLGLSRKGLYLKRHRLGLDAEDG